MLNTDTKDTVTGFVAILFLLLAMVAFAWWMGYFPVFAESAKSVWYVVQLLWSTR